LRRADSAQSDAPRRLRAVVRLDLCATSAAAWRLLFCRRMNAIRSSLALLSWLLVTACGGGLDEAELSAQLGEGRPAVQHNALASDPYQFVFAVRRADAYSFAVNPVGNYSALCPDGVYRTECVVPRLNLSGTGLSVTRQSQLLSRISAEPAAESSSSVLLKGVLVSVRDNRTEPPTHYTEFRASAAYLAPSARPHGGAITYVQAAPNASGYQPARGVNTDLAPRGGGLSLTYWTRFNWVGPLLESPARYPADSFTAVVSYRDLDGTGTFGPFLFEVDQLFLRVTN
jgi:hypothetical protein